MTCCAWAWAVGCDHAGQMGGMSFRMYMVYMCSYICVHICVHLCVYSHIYRCIYGACESYACYSQQGLSAGVLADSLRNWVGNFGACAASAVANFCAQAVDLVRAGSLPCT